MGRQLKTVLTAAAALAILATGPTVYAESGKEHARTMQSGQSGMMGKMNMMEKMSRMMDACTNMMEGMARHQAPQAPKAGRPPQEEG